VASLADQSSQEELRPVAARLISDTIAVALIDRRGAWHQLRWAGPWQLVDSSGRELNPGPLVEAALADPGQTEPLEHWLNTHGVPLDYRAEPPRPRRT
jgi:hypothetical protein